LILHLVWRAVVILHVSIAHIAIHIFAYILILSAIEVKIFYRLNLLVQSFNFELVSINLRLIVFQFLYHFLQLVSSFFQVLLVNLKLFSYFWSTLFSQNVFKFYVKFFFFLNKNILFRNFFCFSN